MKLGSKEESPIRDMKNDGLEINFKKIKKSQLFNFHYLKRTKIQIIIYNTEN